MLFKSEKPAKNNQKGAYSILPVAHKFVKNISDLVSSDEVPYYNLGMNIKLYKTLKDPN